MKKVIAVMCLLCLMGCRKQITIEQYNEAKAYCEVNDMEIKKLVLVTWYGGESKEVYGVECEDSEGNTFPVRINK